MAKKIFISYRRRGDPDKVDHLATILRTSFGQKQVFLDVGGIEGASKWPQALHRQLASTGAMVALLHKEWAYETKKGSDKRRIDDPNDVVRYEISQALANNIPVLPVLLDGAPMPEPDQLPPDLKALWLFQGMPLQSGERFAQDAEAIIRRLRIMLDKRPRNNVHLAVIATCILLFAIILGVALALYLFANQPILVTTTPPYLSSNYPSQELETLIPQQRDGKVTVLSQSLNRKFAR